MSINNLETLKLKPYHFSKTGFSAD